MFVCPKKKREPVPVDDGDCVKRRIVLRHYFIHQTSKNSGPTLFPAENDGRRFVASSPPLCFQAKNRGDKAKIGEGKGGLFGLEKRVKKYEKKFLVEKKVVYLQ